MSKFEGDGRFTIEASLPVPAGTQPMRITRAAARRMINDFLKTGVINHSARGSTAWVIVEYCVMNQIPHTVHTHSEFGGFQITKD